MRELSAPAALSSRPRFLVYSVAARASIVHFQHAFSLVFIPLRSRILPHCVVLVSVFVRFSTRLLHYVTALLVICSPLPAHAPAPTLQLQLFYLLVSVYRAPTHTYNLCATPLGSATLRLKLKLEIDRYRDRPRARRPRAHPGESTSMITAAGLGEPVPS